MVPVAVIVPPVNPSPAVSEVIPLPALGAYEADNAKLALVANDAVAGINVMEVAAEEVVANDAVDGVNVMEVAALAVVAKELLIALDAQLDVPIKVPVNDPLNEPVLI